MIHPPDLHGKVALVTGASRGLGRCIAMALAAHGAQVVVTARSDVSLRETAALIHAAGGVAHAVEADISRIESVRALKARVRESVGPPAILVNAAGVFGPVQPIQESDPERWVEALLINTAGPYLTCQAFVGDMVARGWGRVVSVSSAAALHTPGPLNSAYGTSKAALNHFTRHLAAELAGSGVTANVIHPGEVKTEMWAYIRDEFEALGPAGEGYRQWARWVNETGGDPPEKAAALVLNLVSDAAASINGLTGNSCGSKRGCRCRSQAGNQHGG